MKLFSVAGLLALFLTACGDDPISIKVCPALLTTDPPATGWVRVEFDGSQRSPAGTYHVREEPLFTEWNILEFKDAGEGTIAVRLNAYAVRKMKRFSADPAHQKKPLAININGRWADFMPLLGETSDRMLLYGFTPEEKAQLADYIKNK